MKIKKIRTGKFSDCPGIFDPVQQVRLDVRILASNLLFPPMRQEEQLFEQQTKCSLLQMAILSPELL